VSAANPGAVAALWMLGTLASFVAMSVGGRELSAELGTFQILFVRSVVSVMVICTVLQVTGWQRIRTQRLGLHGFRAVAHFGGQFGWFLGIALLPLAEVVAIEFTTPLWTALLAVVLLGERMTPARALAIASGLAGVLIILRPGFAALDPASFIVLGSAFCYAIAYITVKQLSGSEHPLCILFYMTLVQLPLGAVPAAMQWVAPSPALWPWIGVVGVAALTAHYCVTRAMQVADATVVTPMDFLRLPATALVGWLAYREALHWYVLAGALVMFLGNYASVRAERRRLARIAH